MFFPLFYSTTPLLCRNFLLNLLPKSHLVGLVTQSNTARLACSSQKHSHLLYPSVPVSALEYGYHYGSKFMNKSVLLTVRCELIRLWYKTNGETGSDATESKSWTTKEASVSQLKLEKEELVYGLIIVDGFSSLILIFFLMGSKNWFHRLCLKRLSIT